MARPRLTLALPAAVCAGALIVAATGLWLHHGGTILGTDAPPFMLRWQPKVDGKAWITIVALALALWVAPAILDAPRTPLATAALLYLIALGLGLAVNLGHEGVRGWWAMFATGRSGSFEGRFEYLLGTPLLRHGVGFYLHHFADLLGRATTHVKGNPPGPLVLLHWLGIDRAAVLAALCIGAGSLCAPLAYDLGRVLGGEQRGRIAGLLTASSPSVLLYGVSSFDYLFAALAIAGACLLARPGRGALVAGAAVAGVGTFFSWLLFAIPAYAALLALQRDGWRRTLEIGGACLLAVVVMNGVLAITVGYDVFSALGATKRAYDAGAASARPYAFWLFGSPSAWMLTLGLPIAWFALQGLLRHDPASVTLWAMVVVASVLGLTKAETERIWLPFVPLACASAAAVMSPRRLRPALSFLAVQTLMVELTCFTIW